MSLFLLSMWLLSFILYFYGIGLRYLWFLPIVFMFWFLSYHGMTGSIKNKWGELVNKYSLYIARSSMLIGIVGMLNFFHIDLTKIAIILIVINLVVWIGSYIADYKDGKKVFQVGYYMSIGFLLLVVANFCSRSEVFKICTYLWIVNFAISWFICYIVWVIAPVDKDLTYRTWVFWIWAFVLALVQSLGNIYVALSIGSMVMTGIYVLIYKIVQYTPVVKNLNFSPGKKTNISVRRILAGERITEPKTYFSSQTKQAICEFVYEMPERTKKSLESINITIIGITILNYLTHRQGFVGANQVYYWIIIAFFIGNVLILKKIGFNSILQNLVVFLVINFAIYVSLFSYFEGNFWSIALRGILRNIASSLIVFYAPKFMKGVFQNRDYMYWIIATLMGMCVNIILLIKTTMDWQLIFFISLLYLGGQWMIIFYASNYILKRKDHPSIM